MISVHFQGKPLTIMVIQVCAPTSYAEEDEVEWFYEELQDLIEHSFPTRRSSDLQRGDGKSEHRYSRNQQTKLDWNG